MRCAGNGSQAQGRLNLPPCQVLGQSFEASKEKVVIPTVPGRLVVNVVVRVLNLTSGSPVTPAHLGKGHSPALVGTR